MNMIGFVVLTGVAAFMGARIAMRRCGGGGGWGRWAGWGHHHHRMWRHHHGWGGWTGPGLDEDDGPPEGFGAHPFRGWGRGSFVLRAVMQRIGARPDQEDAARGAVVNH